MTDVAPTLCDRVLLGAESQPRALHECHWITAIGTAIGLSGAAATIGGAAILGGGAATLASGVQRLVNEQYPWDDFGGWMAQDLKAGAIGGGTAALTAGASQAVGPMLGSMAEGLGLSSNIGTTAAEAGAPSGAASLSGQIPHAGVSLLSDAGGATAPQGVLSEALGKLSGAAGEYGGAGASEAAGQVGAQAAQVAKPTAFLAQTLGEKPAALVRSTLTNSALGAARDPEHPLRGALSGAASAAVSTGINYGGNAIFRGQEAGFFSPGPSRGVEFGRMDYQPAGHSLLSEPPSATGFALRPSTGPDIGAGFARAGVSAASRIGAGAASRGVGSALTPSPSVPPPNPYESYGYTPYWMRR